MRGVDAFDAMLPPDALRLGLGCSRLGSIGGASKAEARTLLARAVDEGVRLFDTANIYGQGDSERLVGEALQDRSDCVVVSKAGKYVTWQRRALLPLKSAMRAASRRSSTASGTVSSARARPMPTRWDDRGLTRSLEGSLTRLQRERVDVFMLHSPPADVVRAGDAVGALERARHDGKVGMVGVSVDDVETALACLQDDRVQVLQVPLRPGDDEFHAAIASARLAGVAVVAREILGGPAGAAAQPDPHSWVSVRLRDVIHHPGVSVPVVGATRLATLTATAASARAAASSEL